MNPDIRSGLRESKHFPAQDLARVGFEIHQRKQEFLFGCVQNRLAAATRLALPGIAHLGFRRRITPRIGPLKRKQDELEFLRRESGECQTFPPIRFDLGIRKHAPKCNPYSE
jgi:hypothetical protein